jgi:pyruvate formate lyase activating enzyme
LKKALRYKTYWGADGGITVSGGEALLQMDFVLELFTKAKEAGVNTCLDTSANPFSREPEFLEKFDKLMDVTDLVLLPARTRGGDVSEELRRRRLLRFDLQHAFVLLLCHGLRAD